MSINPVYFSYLNHFDKTVTVRELIDNPITPNMIALRHDVDYDLDLALEMSYWESQRGIRSTYYLLHSAGYWEDTHLVEKCLQFQDFGHEVGLHLNVVSEWINEKDVKSCYKNAKHKPSLNEMLVELEMLFKDREIVNVTLLSAAPLVEVTEEK